MKRNASKQTKTLEQMRIRQSDLPGPYQDEVRQGLVDGFIANTLDGWDLIILAREFDMDNGNIFENVLLEAGINLHAWIEDSYRLRREAVDAAIAGEGTAPLDEVALELEWRYDYQQFKLFVRDYQAFDYSGRSAVFVRNSDITGMDRDRMRKAMIAGMPHFAALVSQVDLQATTMVIPSNAGAGENTTNRF